MYYQETITKFASKKVKKKKNLSTLCKDLLNHLPIFFYYRKVESYYLKTIFDLSLHCETDDLGYSQSPVPLL